jgi:hypothetical protein
MGLWSIQGNQMIRSCANCLEPEAIPYDGERLALDNHMGNWIHLVTERYVQYGIEYVLTGHSSYCVSLLEDGTFTACLGRDISGVWTRDADVDPKTKSACYTLHYSDGNIQKKLEMVIEADKAHITDKSTETMQMYYFCREGKWNYPEQKNLVTGCWNSLLLDVFETGMRAEHQVATDRSITFRADGTLEAYFDGEKTGRWVYTGSFIGLNEIDETLCYVIQFDGEEKGYGVSIKEESRLCISGRDNRTNYNRWFAQVSVEEAEFFAGAKEMVCGVWQATSALLENPETGILDLQTDPSGYHLTFREDGELDVSGTVPMQCTWEQDMYAFELDEGCGFVLYSNGMYYSCTLTQDGKLEVLLPTGEGLVLLVLEKE